MLLCIWSLVHIIFISGELVTYKSYSRYIIHLIKEMELANVILIMRGEQQ